MVVFRLWYVLEAAVLVLLSPEKAPVPGLVELEVVFLSLGELVLDLMYPGCFSSREAVVDYPSSSLRCSYGMVRVVAWLLPLLLLVAAVSGIWAPALDRLVRLHHHLLHFHHQHFPHPSKAPRQSLYSVKARHQHSHHNKQNV